MPRGSRKRRKEREARDARAPLGPALVRYFDARLADEAPGDPDVWRGAIEGAVKRFEPLLVLGLVRVLRVWAGDAPRPAVWMGSLEAHEQRIDVLPPWQGGAGAMGTSVAGRRTYLGLCASGILASAAAEVEDEAELRAIWHAWADEAARQLGTGPLPAPEGASDEASG